MKKIYLTAVLTLGVLMSYGQVIITELADPNDNAGARYVELYNLGSSAVDLSTWKINRYTNGNALPQTPVALTGSIAAGGFYIIAASTSDFNSAYGFDPDQDIGGSGPADSNGDDIIFIMNGADEVVDIFGTPETDGTGTCGEFEDGRAERKASITNSNATFTESEWNVFADSGVSGCTSHTNDPKDAIDMDPKTWIGQPATSNPQPTNHVASFTATTASAAQIDLTWSDNDGAQAAAGFLILASTGSITAPTDFTEVSTDADLSDGSAAVNIGKGIESYSFAGLTPATTYNFSIYPYSNNSTTIDYKIDGTVPTQSTATAASKYNAGDIIISEIMYNSPSLDEEWIEIYNASGSSIELNSDWKLINTNPSYTYTFDGTVTIAAAQYLTIQLGTTGSFPFTASIVLNATDDNQLNNASSTITLTAEDVAIDEVSYDDGNDIRTDGSGPTYEIIDLTADNSSTASNWQASVADIGSPGAASAVTIWTGSTSTAWETAGNWANGLPSASLNAMVPNVSNSPIITGSAIVNDLNTASGVIVTIESAGSLVINDNTIGSGQVTVKRNTPHSTSAGQYSVIGSPVTSATTSSLGSFVYKYDESVAYGANGNARFTEVTTAESMTAGDAYFSANTGAVSFTGTPNTGTVSQTLVYDETADVSAANAGFNLVSNPYTAAIDVDKLVAGNSAISASIYLWQDESSNTTQGSNDDYVVYNSTTDLSTRTTSGGKTFDGFARSTQGFFVKATSAATLNFTASMMDAGNNSDAGFFREANENKDFLRLSLNHNKAYSDIIVVLNDNAASGIDRLYDAYKIGGSAMSLYSFIDNEKFAIQGLPRSSGDVKVGLGFDVEEQGTYTLNFEEGTFEGRVVYLLDTQLDKSINLTETNSYTFTSSKVTSSDRFQLVFSATASLTAKDLEVAKLSIFTDASSLNVRTVEAYENVNIKVMSLNGAIAFEARNVNLSSKAWSAPFNKNGLFIIAIETKDGLLIKKFLN